MRTEFLIVGSGYAGSILAIILTKLGRDVVLIDKASHPRFAIGESSTPIADAMLSALADQYGITELRSLAAYGTWKEDFPDLRCGLKRGFTYFCHENGTKFHESSSHENSSLVAASISDALSDTHWMRSDIDAYLAGLAQRHGIPLVVHATIDSLKRSNKWQVVYSTDNQKHQIDCDWIIDASGNGTFSRSLLNAGVADETLETKARSIFGHFIDVKPMSRIDDELSRSSNWNFDPDASAQHHILRDGWIWMLRFDAGITSVGLMTQDQHTPLRQKWTETLDAYPTIRELLSIAQPVDSVHAPYVASDSMYTSPGNIARMNAHARGDGWIALANAFGFIDPLHSTGIAHNLLSIHRIAKLFADNSRSRIQQSMELYHTKLRDEVRWIDQLVSLCYLGLPNPRLFMDLTAAYFVSVIAQEKSIGDNQYVSDDFLSAGNHELRHAISVFHSQLKKTSLATRQNSYAEIRKSFQTTIAPWNSVDLLSTKTANRISHSAVPKWQSEIS